MSMITTLSKDRQITIPAAEKWESLFEKAKHMKPRHHLTPAKMDELNEKMFR
jgi:hypothetical protein